VTSREFSKKSNIDFEFRFEMHNAKRFQNRCPTSLGIKRKERLQILPWEMTFTLEWRIVPVLAIQGK